LNISDEASIERFAKHIKNEHGGLDVLVNNAAILLPYDANDLATFSKNARETLQVNLFDTLTVCKHMFPLLREHARVVNIASRLGLLLHLTKKELRDKFSADNATEQDIIGLVNQYLK
jgi:carbonyl reductase 1